VQSGLVERLICSGEFEEFRRLAVRFAASYRVQMRASTARSPKANAGQRTSASSRARCSDFVKQQGIIQSDEVKACRALQCLRQVTQPPEILRSERSVWRSKMLAEMAWFGFVAFSGLRMFSYIPQIWRIAADKTGAAAISYTTWGLWTGANASTAVYAATSLHDVWLAFVSGVYAICCVTVIALTALKRQGDGSE
jgi:hypothetical protein